MLPVNVTGAQEFLKYSLYKEDQEGKKKHTTSVCVGTAILAFAVVVYLVL